MANQTIALLATGVEIIHGDILDTNGQRISRRLTDAGMKIGTHIITSDDEPDIHDAILYLLQHHDILIITGGLGPTSDDRTRFALARATHHDLTLHEPSWQRILKRVSQYHLDIHENNQQQALFPKDAHVIVNHNGTADACRIDHENKIIYMLPGPPRECMPIFDKVVFPELDQTITDKQPTWIHYQLFGAIEAEIAAGLDALVADHVLQTGFRASFPYVEFKIQPKPGTDIKQLKTTVEDFIAPYRIAEGNKTASEQCREHIATLKQNIYITDQATQGILQTKLTTPDTQGYLHFSNQPFPENKKEMFIKITGLDGYWHKQKPNGTLPLTIELSSPSYTKTIEHEIPYRNERVLFYATEWLAHQIDKWCQL